MATDRAICILLFFATTINYIDRQTLSVLAPDLQKSLHWNEVDYANIVSAFQITYAIGQVLTGFIVDRIGTFAGFAILRHHLEYRRNWARVCPIGVSIWSDASSARSWRSGQFSDLYQDCG